MKKNLTNTGIAAAIVLIAFAVAFINRAKACDDCKVMAETTIFTNSEEAALPQTVIEKIVSDFLNSPLEETKERKKVLILGYDGFREDGLSNISDARNSAVLSIMDSGGLYHSYAGGTGENLQATSTSPGWTSMLTGGWFDYHGIHENGIEKNDVPTLFETAAQQGYSTVFISSWRDHFDITYKKDIEEAKLRNELSQYIPAENDEDSKNQAIKAIQQNTDIIMAIAEYTDIAGHSTGYGNDNPLYQEACQNADQWGKEILNAVMARETYQNEEWLIIITTDHGGIENSHGSQSKEERKTWFTINQSIAIDEEMLNYSKKN